MGKVGDFLTELKRRNVVRVAFVYSIVAWLLLQIVDIVVPLLELPGWVGKFFLLLIAVGFPLALIFAWAFEITPEGLKLEKHVDRSQSVTAETGRKLDFMIIAVLLFAVALFALDKFVWVDEQVPESVMLAENPAEAKPVSRRSVAVLPFASRSANEDDAFFVDGMHDDVLTHLARIGSLKVISRTSVMEYRDTTKNMRTIGEELGVATILEGGVQRAGDRVRINMQLIDAVTDEHLWADSYDRQLTTANIFAIQSEIASAIAAALHAALSPAEQQALASIPTENLQAYDFFQRARSIQRNSGRKGLATKLQLYEQAVLLDPDFALAHAMLASAYLDRYWFFERDKADLGLARTAIDKAFELNPGMPEAHIALSDYYYHGFLDYNRALEQLDIAIPMVPGNEEAYAIRSFILRRRGDIEDSIPDLQRSIDLDPRNALWPSELGSTYGQLGQWDQAIAYYDKSIRLSPNDPFNRLFRAYAMIALDIDSSALRDMMVDPTLSDEPILVLSRWDSAMQDGDYDLAMDAIGRSETNVLDNQAIFAPLDLMRGLTEFYLGDRTKSAGYFESTKVILVNKANDSPDDPRIFSSLSFVHAGLGERNEALEAAQTAYELLPVNVDAMNGPGYVLNYATTYAMLGQHDAAIEKLEELLSRPSGWSPNHILRNPGFDKLHDEPAFEALMEKYRVRD
ncbi:MAG: tetratricopeptide repeat protein [Gammaproteobacteria bacterium]|nr:tetratricopeptide repeat protein [Gammaproteobacteria bacterium]